MFTTIIKSWRLLHRTSWCLHSSPSVMTYIEFSIHLHFWNPSMRCCLRLIYNSLAHFMIELRTCVSCISIWTQSHWWLICWDLYYSLLAGVLIETSQGIGIEGRKLRVRLSVDHRVEPCRHSKSVSLLCILFRNFIDFVSMSFVKANTWRIFSN